MPERTTQIIRIVYCIVMALVGVFYMLANFWKSSPGFWGLIVVLLALVALILSACGKEKLLCPIMLLLSLAQIPALFCWVKFYNIEFGFLGHYQSIGWFGFAAHLAMTLWGVVLLLKKQ